MTYADSSTGASNSVRRRYIQPGRPLHTILSERYGSGNVIVQPTPAEIDFFSLLPSTRLTDERDISDTGEIVEELHAGQRVLLDL